MPGETQNPSGETKRSVPTQRIPGRMRTVVWAAGIFIVFGAVVAILTSVLVDRLQRQMVEVAQAEVAGVANRAAQEIETIVARRAAEGHVINSLSDVGMDQEIRSRLRILSRDHNVLLTALIDPEGVCIVQTGREGDFTDCPKQKRPGNKMRAAVMPPDSSEPLLVEFELRGLPEGVPEQRVPIQYDDRNIGFLTYGIEEAAALSSLEPISTHISRSLIWMSVVIIVFSGFAILLLTRIATRHGELQRCHDEAQHLAHIGTMASGLAHEIRNPLHAMNLHLDAVREDLEDTRPDSTAHATKVIDNVQKQITSLSHILTNFMNFAMPTRLEQEPVRLFALGGEVGNLLEPEFEAREVRFQREVPENAWIEADPTRVRQVLTNVLLNAAQAVEHRDGDRIVRMCARQEGHKWAVRIEDNGPGIPPGREETLFEVFYSGRKGGTGFGLAIARRIMEGHGGSISAENRPEGGARFTLLFPACKPPANAREVTGTIPPAAMQSEPETIG